MAVSTIPRRSIIRLAKTKSYTIGTTATEFKFEFAIPDGYVIESPVISYGNSPFIVGGIESISSSQVRGYLRSITNSSYSVNIALNAIAIPAELLNTITVT